MSARSFSLVLGTAAGGFLAAGLIPLATAASARADGDDFTPGVDTDFMSGPLQDFGLFTDQSFADPDDSEFVATVHPKSATWLHGYFDFRSRPLGRLGGFGVPGRASAWPGRQ